MYTTQWGMFEPETALPAIDGSGTGRSWFGDRTFLSPQNNQSLAHNHENCI